MTGQKKGITINGEKLNHLRFADDIIIIADAVKDVEVMLQELDNASRKCGLQFNAIQLDQVEEYVYLGQRFTLIENCEGYTTNMLKRKGLQLVYPYINDIWNRDTEINNKNGKEIVWSST